VYGLRMTRKQQCRIQLAASEPVAYQLVLNIKVFWFPENV